MQVTEFLFLENRTSQKKPESNDMDDGIDSARDRRERERRRLILLQPEIDTNENLEDQILII